MKAQEHTQGQGDLPRGLSQPAQRALAGTGIQSLEGLAKFSQVEIKKLHGIGPKALAQLQRALAAKGLFFADEKS
jgi:predicted RecB family nuclease